MVKIGFYINNKNISNVDCSSIVDGNPGIGGTEYLFYLTAYLFKKTYKEEFDVRMLVTTRCIIPTDMSFEVVKDKKSAIIQAINKDFDVLVVKYEEIDFTQGVYDNEASKVKIVIWAHNFIPNHILRKISKLKSISCVVNVGREQLDLYRDSKAFLKSTFIYNGLDIMPKEYYIEHSIPFDKRKNEVTYLGSLIPIKGFHLLAEAWPKIIEEVPDAHLNVIGSGKVYNEKAKLGKYGLADEEYENVFMKYLTDSKGNVLPSVTFYGNMGKEKYTILGRTKVGVPNPSGDSETFCLSAVEMELFQCRIVTKKYVGFLDTVPKSAGILYEDLKYLTDYIIKELKCHEYKDYYITHQYIYDNFSLTVVLNQWRQLFLNLNKGDIKEHEQFISNINYNNKKIREYNRLIKSVLPFGYLLPTLDTYNYIKKRILGR